MHLPNFLRPCPRPRPLHCLLFLFWRASSSTIVVIFLSWRCLTLGRCTSPELVCGPNVSQQWTLNSTKEKANLLEIHPMTFSCSVSYPRRKDHIEFAWRRTWWEVCPRHLHISYLANVAVQDRCRHGSFTCAPEWVYTTNAVGSFVLLLINYLTMCHCGKKKSGHRP